MGKIEKPQTWLLFGGRLTDEIKIEQKSKKVSIYGKSTRTYSIYRERFTKKSVSFSTINSYYSANATRFLRLLFTANKTERSDSDLPRLAKEARSAIASTQASRSASVSQAKR